MPWGEARVAEPVALLTNAGDHLADAVRAWARKPTSNNALRMEQAVETWESGKKKAGVRR